MGDFLFQQQGSREGGGAAATKNERAHKDFSPQWEDEERAIWPCTLRASAECFPVGIFLKKVGNPKWLQQEEGIAQRAGWSWFGLFVSCLSQTCFYDRDGFLSADDKNDAFLSFLWTLNFLLAEHFNQNSNNNQRNMCPLPKNPFFRPRTPNGLRVVSLHTHAHTAHWHTRTRTQTNNNSFKVKLLVGLVLATFLGKKPTTTNFFFRTPQLQYER